MTDPIETAIARARALPCFTAPKDIRPLDGGITNLNLRLRDGGQALAVGRLGGDDGQQAPLIGVAAGEAGEQQRVAAAGGAREREALARRDGWKLHGGCEF